MNDLIIWGAGGHAKVVLDTAIALGYRSIQFVDDRAGGSEQVFGFPVISRLAALGCLSSNAEFVVAIGDNEARARCFLQGVQYGWRAATLIHPSAIYSPNCEIGPGSVILPLAVINAGSAIGQDCIINTGAIIEHDCCISDHAHISPSATLAGNVRVAAFAHVGMGALVLPGVRIGEHSTIGAGAVVLESVPATTTAVGVPARLLNRAGARGLKERASGTKRILLSVPDMSGLEQSYIAEAFASNWLSSVGPNVTAFEEEFGEKLGVHALAVNSGTAAIHLGLRALDVGAGDSVLCSDLTFIASVNPVLYLGAHPIFIDSDASTWNMDPALLTDALDAAAARGRLPKAVIVVHLFGQSADMKSINGACARYGVPVLEDAAEALGASYQGRSVGTLGDVAAFSFNGNKILTTTAGGMLVSNRSEVIGRARFWATQARDPGLAYSHSELGYNYRISNVLAGIGRGQLRVLDLRVQQRQAVAYRYRDAFADLPGISLMPQANYGSHTNWLSCFLIDSSMFGCSRDVLIERLDAANIEARPVWKPMHLQPLHHRRKCYGGAVAEDLFRRGICLPSSSSLSLQDQLAVINQVRAAAECPMIESLHEFEMHCTPQLASKVAART